MNQQGRGSPPWKVGHSPSGGTEASQQGHEAGSVRVQSPPGHRAGTSRDNGPAGQRAAGMAQRVHLQDSWVGDIFGPLLALRDFSPGRPVSWWGPGLGVPCVLPHHPTDSQSPEERCGFCSRTEIIGGGPQGLFPCSGVPRDAWHEGTPSSPAPRHFVNSRTPAAIGLRVPKTPGHLGLPSPGPSPRCMPKGTATFTRCLQELGHLTPRCAAFFPVTGL